MFEALKSIDDEYINGILKSIDDEYINAILKSIDDEYTNAILKSVDGEYINAILNDHKTHFDILMGKHPDGAPFQSMLKVWVI